MQESGNPVVLTSRDHRIRVLYLNYSLDVGGIETLLLEICRRVDATRYSSAVCSLQIGGGLKNEFLAAGIPVFDLPKKEGVAPGLALRLARLCRQNEIQILHSHNYGAWFYAVLSSWLGGGAKLVHTEHSCVDENIKRRILLERLMAKRTSKVIAVSESVRTFLEQRVGIDSRRLCVVPNGVDLSKFESAVNLQAARASLGIPTNHSVIGIVARLAAVKNHEMLLRAFKLVKRDHPNVTLLIVGDGALRDPLERLAQELEMDSIKFLGARRDIAELLGVLDIFVLCSYNEGHPITLLEAMAAGKAVVVTRVGGCAEVVKDGLNGLSVPSGDTTGLAEAISRLLSDPDLGKRFGGEAKKNVKEVYDSRVMIKAYERIYSEVAQKEIRV